MINNYLTNLKKELKLYSTKNRLKIEREEKNII